MSFISRQQLFQPDLDHGSLRRANGQRVVALSMEFIQSLHVALVDQFGPDAQDMLYRSGYEWGLRNMVQLNQQLTAERGGETRALWQMDGKLVLESWWTPLAEAGLGWCAFDLSALSRGLIFIELRGSAIASAFVGSSEEPVCHLYAGLFAAGLSFFQRAERHAVEVQCSALGHAACLFVVGPGSVIDSAETWRQQGTSAAEIVRRLQ